jgi:hypothetical protein
MKERERERESRRRRKTPFYQHSGSDAFQFPPRSVVFMQLDPVYLFAHGCIIDSKHPSDFFFTVIYLMILFIIRGGGIKEKPGKTNYYYIDTYTTI